MAYVSLLLACEYVMEGHLSGGIMGTLCAFTFINHGPQRPEPFADEQEEDEKEEESEILKEEKEIIQEEQTIS